MILFGYAVAANPDNGAIRDAVKRHKDKILTTRGVRAGRPARAGDLFMLHKGATAAWPFLGATAVQTVRDAALRLIKGDIV